MTVESKSNQGMRQPQLGGISGDLSKQGVPTSAICRHGQLWRKSPDHKWICAVCHPPAVQHVEWRAPRAQSGGPVPPVAT